MYENQIASTTLKIDFIYGVNLSSNRSIRIAVSGLFLINGFLYANWASRLPELQDLLEISHSTIGTLLLTLAAGAVIAMPFTGWLSERFGGVTIIQTTSVFLTITIGSLAISENLIITGLTYFIIGISNGAMDVVMNEQAVLLERKWTKPIMSSFHAVWSIGLAIGAGTGSLFSKMGIGMNVHLPIIAMLGMAGFALTFKYLIRGIRKGSSVHFAIPKKSILLLGIIAFCGMLSEGAMADWSAIFMRSVVGQSESFSAFAFGLFGTAMFIGRLVGDHATHIFGKKKTLVVSALLSILGFVLVVFISTMWPTMLGYSLVGIGVANVVPIIYSTAGNTPGISPSRGIAMATTIGYTGFFVGPPVIGFLSDVYDLQVGLGFAMALVIMMLVLISFQRFERKN